MAARVPPVQYVSVSTAARILRVNVGTLYKAIHAQEVPYVQLGREFVIPVEFLGVTPEPIEIRAGTELFGQLLLDLRW
jgi:excisionase family DNA binding protein